MHSERAGFRIYRTGDSLSYAMNCLNSKGSKALLPITSCPILLESIQTLMSPLLHILKQSKRLSHRLFGLEFLSGLSGEIIASLLYHGALDFYWEAEARYMRLALAKAQFSISTKITLAPANQTLQRAKIILGGDPPSRSNFISMHKSGDTSPF
ncbi:MAG: hypothetical protein ACTTH5_02595 [Wolinella sp.]